MYVRDGFGLPSFGWNSAVKSIWEISPLFVRHIHHEADVLSSLGPRTQRRPPAKPLDFYPSDTEGRDIGIRGTYATGDYTLLQVAQCFGVHYSTVSRIVKRGLDIEDANDSRVFWGGIGKISCCKS